MMPLPVYTRASTNSNAALVRKKGRNGRRTLKRNSAQAIATITAQYQNEPLVQVLPSGQLASLAHVVHTPNAAISLTPVSHDFLIINVAIDNLLKGASSQAVQNFNLMFGFPETLGLLKTGCC